MVTVPLPHLGGLAAAVRVNLDWRIPTMGIFASGRLLVNPGFAARLKDNELVFVLAHELLHLALRTHDRARGSGRLEFNYAHDYIINDILRVELGFASIPAGGLDMPGARSRSAEDIVIEMRRNAELMQSRTQVFEGKQISVRRMFGQGGQPADGKPANENEAGDVLADKTEREMFPADAQEQAKQKAAIDEIAARGMALAKAARGHEGTRQWRGRARPAPCSRSADNSARPGNSALQRWIESSAPGRAHLHARFAARRRARRYRVARTQAAILDDQYRARHLGFDDRGDPDCARCDRVISATPPASIRSASCNATPPSPRT